MIRDGDRILTTKPGLTLRPARPEDEALSFRIFVASKALEFAACRCRSSRRISCCNSSMSRSSTTGGTTYPCLEQWIIESDGEPVGRLIFSNLPDQIMPARPRDAARKDGRRRRQDRHQGRDLRGSDSRGKIARASVTPYNPARKLYARLGVSEVPSTGNSPMIPLEWLPPTLC